MGGLSEREYGEKLDKIKKKMMEKARDLGGQFDKIEKARVDLLKKAKETRHDIEREILKMEDAIVKSKDLAPESKRRLRLEMDNLKSEVREEYSELESRIAETVASV